jgi:hypothetical protein
MMLTLWTKSRMPASTPKTRLFTVSARSSAGGFACGVPASKTSRRLSLVGMLAAAAWGCDGTPATLDAATAPSARMAALSLRLDAVPAKAPTLSVLGFRATFSGIAASDVLGLVDPLAGATPAHDCQLRDIDSAAAALGAAGNGIELEELSGVGVSMVDASAAIRTSPRLFPDVAPSIGGVVSEAGPLVLQAWPEQVRITNGLTNETVPLALSVPSPGQVTSINGLLPIANTTLPVAGDLNLGFKTSGSMDHAVDAVEIRPFGATVALICRLPSAPAKDAADGTNPLSFVVSHQLIRALVAATGAASGSPVAASLDLVRRPAGEAALADTRVAIEARTSLLVELHP